MENSPDETADSNLGRMVAEKYRIGQRIGVGGMSRVYLAEHTLLNRSVALKLLSRDLAFEDTSRKRFLAEARIASQIDHPNAVLIYDVGLDGDVPFIVMEYIRGRTLRQVLQEKEPMPLERIARILQQSCAALADAHTKGIVHRDIKPTNLMLVDGPADRIKVLDFGIAKVLNAIPEASSELTTSGAIVGTPHYMSPEQGLHKPLTARSDIYSFGVVLYELLSGVLPFEGPSSVLILIKHVNDPPKPLREQAPERNIPPAVEAVVMRCLEKDPEQRWSSAEELAAAFQSAVADTQPKSITATAVGAENSAAQLHTNRSIRNAISLSIVLGAALIVVVAGFLLLSRGESKPSLPVEHPVTAVTTPAAQQPSPEALQQQLDEELRVKAKLEEENRRQAEQEALMRRQQEELRARSAETEALRRQIEEAEAARRQEAELRKAAEAAREAELARKSEEQALRNAEAEAARRRAAALQQPAPSADSAERAAAVRRAEEERLQLDRELEAKRRTIRDLAEAEARAKRARAAAQAAQQTRSQATTTTSPPAEPQSNAAADQPARKRRCGPTWCP